jgi:RHH-type proline utilization regulon transcriptional repressor/proline dehydrogenase/delta 1-pyrroline-5-carboxylate dehydrogenase
MSQFTRAPLLESPFVFEPSALFKEPSALFKEPSALFEQTSAQASLDDWFECLSALYDIDENDYVEALAACAETGHQDLNDTIKADASSLIKAIRSSNQHGHAVEQLLQEYSLDNDEGLILMCLAEALLRIPDRATANALIRDKLCQARWDEHLGHSDSFLVNASSWALLLGTKTLQADQHRPSGLLAKLISRLGEPLVRQAMFRAMRMMGEQFVLGRDVTEALKNSRAPRNQGYAYSYDMLGEAALTDKDAERYLQAYQDALSTLGEAQITNDANQNTPSLSIKLSALHPRYQALQSDTVMAELLPKLRALAAQAREQQIPLTIDAEEADRLELSLCLFQALYQSPEVRGWSQLGLAVQAYSKRALVQLAWLNALALAQGDRINVRLVKGAYWDSEIKHAQALGLAGYPVFTRKENTDLSYLVCADFLLSPAVNHQLYPQFATHNAHTVSSVLALAKKHQQNDFEFQRLHGMGESLYQQLLLDQEQRSIRIYAPIGAHQELLPYLVRRLLENGANASFVHRLGNADVPIEQLTRAPLELIQQARHAPSAHQNPHIALPANLFLGQRKNSQGCNLAIGRQREQLLNELQLFRECKWLYGHGELKDQGMSVRNPAKLYDAVGVLRWADGEEALAALEQADKAWFAWNQRPTEQRADCLDSLADLLEQNRAELMALCIRETGKTCQDSIDEVREAVDFCRYYAHQARSEMSTPTRLPAITGECNEHYYAGRGVFLCISPWNFPLAIFIGQISAALVSGNTVLAKPAEQSSLIAARTIELCYQAGIPEQVLHYLPGAGASIANAILEDDRLSGVAFTGSTETAHRINRKLAKRSGSIATFIAETGGQNAMIVDSSAHPEQVIVDVMQSAFTSAGQRCSALRLLCLQEDIADRVIELLTGALKRFVVGDPQSLSSDCGPVIDQQAQKQLQAYINHWREQGWILAEAPSKTAPGKGYYVSPIAIEIEAINELGKEQFGPILHVYRYSAQALDKVISDLNRTGYGLTLGIHSRNEASIAYIEKRLRVGNCYINRNQVGAVVGCQPFGGRGLSGTGPKAGGPNYLKRFATERVRTTNTSAIGGNSDLLSS